MYAFDCPACQKKLKRATYFEANVRQGAPCPICGREGRRLYISLPAFHPTKGNAPH